MKIFYKQISLPVIRQLASAFIFEIACNKSYVGIITYPAATYSCYSYWQEEKKVTYPYNFLVIFRHIDEHETNKISSLYRNQIRKH